MKRCLTLILNLEELQNLVIDHVVHDLLHVPGLLKQSLENGECLSFPNKKGFNEAGWVNHFIKSGIGKNMLSARDVDMILFINGNNQSFILHQRQD